MILRPGVSTLTWRNITSWFYGGSFIQESVIWGAVFSKNFSLGKEDHGTGVGVLSESARHPLPASLPFRRRAQSVRLKPFPRSCLLSWLHFTMSVGGVPALVTPWKLR